MRLSENQLSALRKGTQVIAIFFNVTWGIPPYPIDHRNKHVAGVAPRAHGAEGQREPDASHRVGYLVVEELLEPDLSEHG